MMDHHELPKGRFPDTLKDEDIQDRYILRGPPTGQVLGSFNSFQLGLLWKIPVGERSEMLKATAPDRFVEEKIFYEQNFEKHPKVGLPMKLALYKVSNSSDLHIRAVYWAEGDDPEEDAGNGLYFLRSKKQVFGVAVVNESGKALLDEKFARSYMCVGERFWEIPSLISAKELGMSNLLTTDGSLLLRITFGNSEDRTPEHFGFQEASTAVDQTLSSDIPPVSGQIPSVKAVQKKLSSANVKDEDSNPMVSSAIDISTVGLDPIPFHLTTFARIGKFTDGTVHVVEQSSGQSAEFQVHRVVLAARSPYFEAEFGVNSKVTIDKYTILCMKTALDYIYSNKIKSKDFNLLTQLIQVAEELEIGGFKSKCLNGLVDCPIDIPQAMSIFKLGIKHNSVVLRVHAHDFLIKLKGKIGIHTEDFKTFMEETDTQILFDWLLRS